MRLNKNSERHSDHNQIFKISIGFGYIIIQLKVFNLLFGNDNDELTTNMN